MKKDEVSMKCSTHREMRNSYKLINLKEGGHLNDLVVGGRIHPTQDRVPWRAFVNTVMNLWVP
jgi:hypothetical protein